VRPRNLGSIPLSDRGAARARPIETHRLRLEPLDREIAALVPSDRGVAERKLGAVFHDAWPSDDLRDWLDSVAAESRFRPYAIVERATNTVVGDVGFLGPPDAKGQLEVGYSIVSDRRRGGYASEAAAAVVMWALEQVGVKAIIAECQATNTASIRTLERLGFQRREEADGVIRWRHVQGAASKTRCVSEPKLDDERRQRSNRR
jgi:[ribosomal protein S5]-alanine N-acetyltransferase